MLEKETVATGIINGIKQNSRLAIITGVIMVVCGTLAIASPLAAGLSITILVGTILSVGGIAQCFLAFKTGAFGQGLLIFLMGALTVVAGFYLFSRPVEGLATITIFLAAYFIVTGIFELIAAVQIRPSDGWGWMLVNGIVTLFLGIMIWRQFPLSEEWAVGVLFGIKLIMSGWALIFIGRAINSTADETAV